MNPILQRARAAARLGATVTVVDDPTGSGVHVGNAWLGYVSHADGANLRAFIRNLNPDTLELDIGGEKRTVEFGPQDMTAEGIAKAIAEQVPEVHAVAVDGETVSIRSNEWQGAGEIKIQFANEGFPDGAE